MSSRIVGKKDNMILRPIVGTSPAQTDWSGPALTNLAIDVIVAQIGMKKMMMAEVAAYPTSFFDVTYEGLSASAVQRIASGSGGKEATQSLRSAV
mmetsp:Transcript_126377/g.365853  ORF Transcript_126377/g.365853 Transcript_126377/m.365853 type:complete len:95 (+) Transcript_126377:890-1174(+)